MDGGARQAQFTFEVHPRSVLRIGLAIALVLVAVSWITQVPQAELPVEDINRKTINVDSESSVPTWASSAGLLLAAAMLFSISRRAAGWRKHWLGLAVLFAGLSMDEAVAFHEKTIQPLRDAFDLGGVFFFAWVVPAAIAVGVLALVLRRFVWAIEPPERWILVLSAVLYVGGALGMELVGGAIADAQGQRNVTYITVVSIEELLEMLGIVVFLYGLARVQRAFDAGPGSAQVVDQARP